MAEQPKQPQVVNAQAAAAPKDNQNSLGGTSTAKRRRKKKQGVPFLLKLILVPFLMFVALIAGAIAGYSILGKGNALDVFDLHTWQHIYDLVFG